MDLSYNWLAALVTVGSIIVIVAAGRLLLFRIPAFHRAVDFNTAERRLREAYRDRFDQRLERIAATSRQHAIPLLQLHTETPVLEQVREQLGPRRP